MAVDFVIRCFWLILLFAAIAAISNSKNEN